MAEILENVWVQLAIILLVGAWVLQWLMEDKLDLSPEVTGFLFKMIGGGAIAFVLFRFFVGLAKEIIENPALFWVPASFFAIILVIFRARIK